MSAANAEVPWPPYREAWLCWLLGHKLGPWGDLPPRPGESEFMAMQYRRCVRGRRGGLCDGSDMRFKPR